MPKYTNLLKQMRDAYVEHMKEQTTKKERWEDPAYLAEHASIPKGDLSPQDVEAYRKKLIQDAREAYPAAAEGLKTTLKSIMDKYSSESALVSDSGEPEGPFGSHEDSEDPYLQELERFVEEAHEYNFGGDTEFESEDALEGVFETLDDELSDLLMAAQLGLKEHIMAYFGTDEAIANAVITPVTTVEEFSAKDISDMLDQINLSFNAKVDVSSESLPASRRFDEMIEGYREQARKIEQRWKERDSTMQAPLATTTKRKRPASLPPVWTDATPKRIASGVYKPLSLNLTSGSDPSPKPPQAIGSAGESTAEDGPVFAVNRNPRAQPTSKPATSSPPRRTLPPLTASTTEASTGETPSVPEPPRDAQLKATRPEQTLSKYLQDYSARNSGSYESNRAGDEHLLKFDNDQKQVSVHGSDWNAIQVTPKNEASFDHAVNVLQGALDKIPNPIITMSGGSPNQRAEMFVECMNKKPPMIIKDFHQEFRNYSEQQISSDLRRLYYDTTGIRGPEAETTRAPTSG